MAGSTRAELAASSLDGSNFASAYPNGQRGTYSSSNLDRPGSFCESFENRMMVPGTMALKNAATSPEVPVTQYMPLEPFSTSELKTARFGELRRVLGISVEDHLFGSSQAKPLPPVSWEELKQFRASVEETWSKAKERKKMLQDSLLKLDKVRNIVSKKRQRNEIQSNEEASNSNLLKIGSQVHQNPSDLAGQRLEERTKNGVPNKRVRSSMAEVRAFLPYSLQPEGRNNLPGRQSTMLDKDKSILVDKDKSMLRPCNAVPIAIDDKMSGRSAGGDGWENNMKRKRSAGTVVNRTPPDGARELKQSIQQRPSNEPRPRSGDGLGFRSGSSNGIMGNNKMDSISQVSGASIIPRNDLGYGSLSNDRRERSSKLDKEQATAKGNNKLNTCEDAQLGNQSRLTKGKAVRAPRTGAGVVINTPSFPRSSGAIDGSEQPSCLNKVQTLTGASNRKRSSPTGASSPPVATWGGQRREKISRTRRANVISPVSNFDEAQAEGLVAPDVGARLSSMESSKVLYNRAIPNNTHLKLKVENVPSLAAPSESEESIVHENKSKEKGTNNGEIDDGTLNAVHKAATFVLPTKKNTVPLREEIGDGVRRQGRSGRGSVHSKAFLQLNKEKLESLETAKPLKSRRLTSDKPESRVGRPPSKKVSERKGSNCPLQIINSGSSELAGASDDDREELLAVATAVRNASCLKKSGSFWKEIEPLFALVSSKDLALLKHQINFAEALDVSLSNMLDDDYSVMAGDTCQAVPSHISQQVGQTNLVGLKKCDRTTCSVDELQPVKAAALGKIETERWSEKTMPLSHRLLSAFISEEGTDVIDSNTKQGDASLQFSSDCSPYSTNSFVENEHGSDLTKYGLEFDNDLGSQTNCYGDSTPCNGFASPSTTYRGLSNFISGDELLQENDGLVRPYNPDIEALCEFEQDKSNQQEPMNQGLSDTSLYQCQFEHMSLDDKIMMELLSIGIYPDAVPDLAEGDDGEIDKAVSEHKIRLYQQVRKKKSQLCNLEKVIQEQRDLEMRNLEQLAMNKLVEAAYKKLQGGRGSHGSSHKSGANKVSKQLAMAFAKRTLARCQKFEETGQSCFSEPILRDALFSQPVHDNDANITDGMSSERAPIMNVELRNCQLGSRVSAFGVSSNIIVRHGPIHKIDRSQLDPYQGLTHFSGQTFVRNDPINRGKKREVLLDDVVTGAASRATPPINSTLPGCAKWKKTDKDHSTLPKNSAPNGIRPSLSSGRGERKTKTKPKQKIAQLTTSGNGLGRVTETTNMLPSMQESREIVNYGSIKGNLEVELASSCSSAQDLSKEMEDNIFINLPLQGIDSIDELDVADGLGGQGQDIGSWLNVDDDALQDNDLVGLEIPMDDLSELKLSF